jgi:hypothetical protein
MSITLSLDRDRANEVVKQALEMMDTIDEYADEGSHIVATQKASGLGSGNAAKLTIKFWPDGDSTRIEYETKKGNPLDLTTDTDEIEEEFQGSVQHVRDTPSEDTEQRERRKEAESTGSTTLKDAAGEAAQKVDETVEQVKKERDSGSPVEDESSSPVEQNEETAPSTSEDERDTSDDEEKSFREQVNEELEDREIGTDSDQTVTEQVSDIRRGDEQEKAGSQPSESPAPSSDEGVTVTGAIVAIGRGIVALILLAIGLFLMGGALGLLMISPL